MPGVCRESRAGCGKWTRWAPCAILSVIGAGSAAAGQQAEPRPDVGAASSAVPGVAEHPLKPVIRIAQSSLQTLAGVKDYEAAMVKRELIGDRLILQSMTIRFRETPFSVYLGFNGENTGREVLYVDGKYQNMILAHEGSGLKSLVGTVSLSPTGKDVMAENRYPITSIGLRNLLKKLIERWEEEAKFGECDVKYYQNAKLDESQCLVIECSHPQPRRQFKFHLTRLFIDKQTNLPVRVENYSFPARDGEKPMLQEEYTYRNLRVNVGLTDLDFDRSNRDYAF